MRATERAFGHLRAWHALHRLLERADIPLKTVELVYAAIGSAGLLAGIFGFAAAGMSTLITFGAMVVGGGLPIFIVWHKAKRRLAAIDDQLPDLLVTLAATLKAGHSFRQGIQAVVDEGQPPASKEFKRVLTETRLGRPMDDALADMAARIGSKNVTFVVTAVTIQRQVGGSLAGIFDMVAEAVRNRQQFARKIRSLTAMGRASAYVLVGVPFFMLGTISLLSPEYMAPLYHTTTGKQLMILGLHDDRDRIAHAQEDRLLQGLITDATVLRTRIHLPRRLRVSRRRRRHPARPGARRAVRRAANYGRHRAQPAGLERLRFHRAGASSP